MVLGPANHAPWPKVQAFSDYAYVHGGGANAIAGSNVVAIRVTD
jgi:hypothetical protein